SNKKANTRLPLLINGQQKPPLEGVHWKWSVLVGDLVKTEIVSDTSGDPAVGLTRGNKPESGPNIVAVGAGQPADDAGDKSGIITRDAGVWQCQGGCCWTRRA
ncbi:unnamed protein product, partial [Ectocarpus sp. 13 AM-2016]